MNERKHVLIRLGMCLVFMFIIFLFVDKVSAAYGSWDSSVRRDYNGMSEVGTTYTGGMGSSRSIKLKVRTKNYMSVGERTIGCAVDQRVSHICWGQPMTERFGTVLPGVEAYHSPFFYE